MLFAQGIDQPLYEKRLIAGTIPYVAGGFVFLKTPDHDGDRAQNQARCFNATHGYRVAVYRAKLRGKQLSFENALIAQPCKRASNHGLRKEATNDGKEKILGILEEKQLFTVGQRLRGTFDTTLADSNHRKPLAQDTARQDPATDARDQAHNDHSDGSDDEDFETYQDVLTIEMASENVSSMISRLYRLSFKIRNPTTRLGFSKAHKYQETDSETGVDLIQVFADFDRQHMEQVFLQFWKGEDIEYVKEHYLVKRLAKANTRRRQQFRQWRHHRNKIAARSTLTDSFKLLITSSRVTGQTHIQEHERVGQIPGQPAPSIPSTATRLDPAAVIIDDTASMISSSTEHPGNPFHSIKSWQKHVASQHLEDPSPSDYALPRMNVRPVDDTRRCLICLEENVNNEHVGIHLQQLALYALPRYTGFEDELDSGEDASAATADDPERLLADKSDVPSFNEEGDRPSDSFYGVDYNIVGNSLGDLDPYELSQDHCQIHDNWNVVHNPRLRRLLQIELKQDIVHDSFVTCVEISYHSRFVACRVNRGALIYELETGAKYSHFLLDSVEGVGVDEGNYIRGVSFDSKVQRLAIASEDRIIRVRHFNISILMVTYTNTAFPQVFDIVKQAIMISMAGHEQDIYGICFFPDSSLLVSGSDDWTVRLWDTRSGKEQLKRTLDDRVNSVACSHDGKLFAAGSLNKNVVIWNLVGVQ
ncbi:MAG: hypothetical protein Q9181_006640 [Wetmoreana brouardii]